MVYTASATSAQQGKVTRLYSGYIQVVDNSVDNFISVDFVVDKFLGLVGRQNTRSALYPSKTPMVIKHFIMQKCVFYTVFSIVQVSNF